MRESIAALAVIRRLVNGQSQWLAQWNPAWQRYSFVGGHKLPDESFRECVVREIGEELGLNEPADVRVADHSLAWCRFESWSESAGAITQYEITLFEAEPAGDAAWRTISANAANRWLTAAEIRALRTTDDLPVSETLGHLLSKLE